MKLDLNINKIYKTKTCGDVQILKFIEHKKVKANSLYLIKFLNTGSTRIAALSNIKKGEVLDKSIIRTRKNKYGGTGKIFLMDENPYKGKLIQNYVDRWRNLLRRVSIDKSYTHVNICDEWYNFDNFYNFISDERNGFKGEGYELDKDILSHNKKDRIYSPETCLFIPRLLNAVLLDRKNHKEAKYPLGVNDNPKWKYDTVFSSIQRGNKKITLCSSNREGRIGLVKCFSYYKYAKEYFLKLLSNYMLDKSLITTKVRDAVHKYEVHDKRDVDDIITDNETYLYILRNMSSKDKVNIESKIKSAFEKFKSRIK